MNLICFADRNWSEGLSSAKQLLTRLAKRGHRILYFDPHGKSGLRDAGPCTLYVHTEKSEEVIRSLWFADAVVLTTSAGSLPDVALLHGRPAVYYGADHPGDRFLQSMDVAITTSPALLPQFRQAQPRSYVLEPGADVQRFSPGTIARTPQDPEVAALPQPVVCFLGDVDPALITQVAHSRPEWTLVVAGATQHYPDAPNLHVLGNLAYERVPAILRSAAVCVPSAVYLLDCMASGRPVVTPRDASGLLADIADAVAKPQGISREHLSWALANSWDERAYQFEAHLEEARAAAIERGVSSTARSRAVAGASVDSVWPDRTERLEEYGRSLTEPVTPLFRGIFQVTQAAGSIYYALRYAARVLTGKRDPAVRKILIGRRAVMGDIIVLSPMLAALRERYPEARIVMAVQRGMPAGALLECSKDVDEIRVLDFLDSTSRVEQLKGVFRLFAEGFDVTFSGSSYFLVREVFLAGAPKRFGIYNGLALQKKNKEVLPADLTVHEAEINVQLIELLTGQPEDRLRSPQLALDPKKIRQRTAELLPKLAIPMAAKILTVHAGSKNPTRRWPAERFAELSTRLLSEDPALWLVFTGSPGERILVEQIRAGIPTHLQNRVIDTTGITDLYSLSGLLAMSKATLSNDTGVMHLARTTGTPLVAVLGPENDRRWSPHPMGDAPAIAVRNIVPCAPCSRDACEPLYCLRSMSVDRIYAEITRLLHSTAAPGFSRLERKITHADWSMLADAGFDPPRMSVVVIAGDDVAPGFVEALADQSYPAFDTFVLQSDLSRGADAFQSMLNGAKGDMLSLLTSEVPWEPERLSAHAAVLTRDPHAAYAYTAPRNSSRGHRSELDLGAYTFRRSEIERALPEMRSSGSASFMEMTRMLIRSDDGIAADVPQPRQAR